jgi:hypothetical protein
MTKIIVAKADGISLEAMNVISTADIKLFISLLLTIGFLITTFVLADNITKELMAGLCIVAATYSYRLTLKN